MSSTYTSIIHEICKLEAVLVRPTFYRNATLPSHPNILKAFINVTSPILN